MRAIHQEPRDKSTGSMANRSMKTTEMNNHLHYDPLPAKGRYTRVIQLLPRDTDRKISCRLLQIDLDRSQTEYTAVSYTWGAQEPQDAQKTILVDGIEFPVRDSLYDLLHAFCDSHQIQTLWIDALCINQASLMERNHQVKMMGEIFTKAKEVKAWLGKGDQDTPRAMAHINGITSMSHTQQIQLRSHEIQQLETSLQQLANLRYWSRAWIIQELVLAKDVTFFAAQDHISWNQLVQAVSMVDKGAVRNLRTIIVTKYLGKETWSFAELFAMFGHLGCTYEADRFYSLHGLLSFVQNLPAPDYSLCINEVLKQHLELLSGDPGIVMHIIQHYVSFSNVKCQCHMEVMLDLDLKYHGEFCCVTQNVANGSGGASGHLAASDVTLYSNNDMYKFRHFTFDGKYPAPKASDLAFELKDQWYVVYRDGKIGFSDGGAIAGLVFNSPTKSEYFDVANCVTILETIPWSIRLRLLYQQPSLNQQPLSDLQSSLYQRPSLDLQPLMNLRPLLNLQPGFLHDPVHLLWHRPGDLKTDGLELRLPIPLHSLFHLARFMTQRTDVNTLVNQVKDCGSGERFEIKSIK